MSHDTKMTEALVEYAKASDKKERGDKILSYYQNSVATYYGALGHSKAAANRHFAEVYATELKELGLHVPTFEEAGEAGKFNGSGSQ